MIDMVQADVKGHFADWGKRVLDLRFVGIRRPSLGRLVLPYVLIAPFFAFVAVFVFWPIAYSVFLSTFDWQLGTGDRVYIGLENFVRLFGSQTFQNAFRNTMIYAVAVGCVSIALGLTLAVIVKYWKHWTALWQTVFFLPVCATSAAMAVVFRFILHADIGVLNAAIEALGGIPRDWLQHDATAMLAVIVVGIWNTTGYAMVLFIAGLTAVPRELNDAAVVDGANKQQVFWRVTFPLLSPTTLFVVIIVTRRSMEAFDTVQILTSGGPLRATQVLSHLLFEEGFRFFDTGYASSIAVIFFALLVSLAFLQKGMIDSKVHYE